MGLEKLGVRQVGLQYRRPRFYSWVGTVQWRRDRLPTPVLLGFPCGSAGKESASNVGDLGLILGLGRSPGEGKGYTLQNSVLENSMNYSPWGHKKVDMTEPLSHNRQLTHPFTQHAISQSKRQSLQTVWEALLSQPPCAPATGPPWPFAQVVPSARHSSLGGGRLRLVLLGLGAGREPSEGGVRPHSYLAPDLGL